MSHIETVKTTLTDIKAVRAACERLGVEFVEGKRTYKWYGRALGKVPEGLDPKDLGKCDHVIKVPGVEYEVGLVQAKDGKGYRLAYDLWGPGAGLAQKFGKSMDKLIDAYSVEALKLKARAKGYLTSEKVTTDGKILLTVTGF